MNVVSFVKKLIQYNSTKIMQKYASFQANNYIFWKCKKKETLNYTLIMGCINRQCTEKSTNHNISRIWKIVLLKKSQISQLKFFRGQSWNFRPFKIIFCESPRTFLFGKNIFVKKYGAVAMYRFLLLRGF